MIIAVGGGSCEAQEMKPFGAHQIHVGDYVRITSRPASTIEGVLASSDARLATVRAGDDSTITVLSKEAIIRTDVQMSHGRYVYSAIIGGTAGALLGGVIAVARLQAGTTGETGGIPRYFFERGVAPGLVLGALVGVTFGYFTRSLSWEPGFL